MVEDRRAYMREYNRAHRQTEAGKAARKRANERWAAKNPELVRALARGRVRRYWETELGQFHIKARAAVNNALAVGRITRGSCLDCGSPKTEGHHARGYDREHWLDVEWLCRAHHAMRHARERIHTP